jgi:hypothetical protein
LFDAILHLLALALLDQAFEANIQTVQDFYKIKVRPQRRSPEFDWRKDIRDKPIFRQAVSTSDGTVRTSDTEALRYHTYFYYLQRLGLVTGFVQILNPYCIRRGSGEGVEGKMLSLFSISLVDFMQPLQRRHNFGRSCAT